LDRSVSIKQTLGSAGQQEGKSYSQWNVQLTAGSETVKSVDLTVEGGAISQYWELVKQATSSVNSNALPAYRTENGGLAKSTSSDTSSNRRCSHHRRHCPLCLCSLSPAVPSAPSPSAAPAKRATTVTVALRPAGLG
jgi:hypothetical protein